MYITIKHNVINYWVERLDKRWWLYSDSVVFFYFHFITYTMHKRLYCLSNIYLYSTILFDQLVMVCTVLSNRFVTFFLTILSIFFFTFLYRFILPICDFWTALLRDYYMTFTISASGISSRLSYEARQRSWKTDMGRGRIPGTIWKISCHNLFITYLTLTFSKHWLLYLIQDLWTDKLRK